MRSRGVNASGIVLVLVLVLEFFSSVIFEPQIFEDEDEDEDE
jgi:hypothetical protein